MVWNSIVLVIAEKLASHRFSVFQQSWLLNLVIQIWFSSCCYYFLI